MPAWPPWGSLSFAFWKSRPLLQKSRASTVWSRPVLAPRCLQFWFQIISIPFSGLKKMGLFSVDFAVPWLPESAAMPCLRSLKTTSRPDWRLGDCFWLMSVWSCRVRSLIGGCRTWGTLAHCLFRWKLTGCKMPRFCSLADRSSYRIFFLWVWARAARTNFWRHSRAGLWPTATRYHSSCQPCTNPCWGSTKRCMGPWGDQWRLDPRAQGRECQAGPRLRLSARD